MTAHVHVLPLNVFMQVYVPENLWISSSAACGTKLKGEDTDERPLRVKPAQTE